MAYKKKIEPEVEENLDPRPTIKPDYLKDKPGVNETYTDLEDLKELEKPPKEEPIVTTPKKKKVTISTLEDTRHYTFIKPGQTIKIGNTVYSDIHLQNTKTVQTLKKILHDNFDKLIHKI